VRKYTRLFFLPLTLCFLVSNSDGVKIKRGGNRKNILQIRAEKKLAAEEKKKYEYYSSVDERMVMPIILPGGRRESEYERLMRENRWGHWRTYEVMDNVAREQRPGDPDAFINAHTGPAIPAGDLVLIEQLRTRDVGARQMADAAEVARRFGH
jgi:hypothetical protein